MAVRCGREGGTRARAANFPQGGGGSPGTARAAPRRPRGVAPAPSAPAQPRAHVERRARRASRRPAPRTARRSGSRGESGSRWAPGGGGVAAVPTAPFFSRAGRPRGGGLPRPHRTSPPDTPRSGAGAGAGTVRPAASGAGGGGRSPDQRLTRSRESRRLPAPVPNRPPLGARPAPLFAPWAWAPTCRGPCPSPGRGAMEGNGETHRRCVLPGRGRPPGAAPFGALVRGAAGGGGAPRALQPSPGLEPRLQSFSVGWGADFQGKTPPLPDGSQGVGGGEGARKPCSAESAERTGCSRPPRPAAATKPRPRPPLRAGPLARSPHALWPAGRGLGRPRVGRAGEAAVAGLAAGRLLPAGSEREGKSLRRSALPAWGGGCGWDPGCLPRNPLQI